ncbi:MAG: competence protein ComF [Pauljensenia sp.]
MDGDSAARPTPGPPSSTVRGPTSSARPGRTRGRGILAGLGAALLDVVLPVQCVGCAQWDALLCPGCAALAGGPAQWEVLDGPTRASDLGLWSLGAGIVTSGLLAGVGEVWVVPAPSGWRRRYRDQMVAPGIADGVAREVAAGAGVTARVVEPVGLRPFSGSQSGRSGGERRSGRLDSMKARVEVPAGIGVVLVDDVVTTGATLRELARVCGPGTVAAAALCRAGGPGTGPRGGAVSGPRTGPEDQA